jgi:hypothetical protein
MAVLNEHNSILSKIQGKYGGVSMAVLNEHNSILSKTLTIARPDPELYPFSVTSTLRIVEKWIVHNLHSRGEIPYRRAGGSSALNLKDYWTGVQNT